MYIMSFNPVTTLWSRHIITLKIKKVILRGKKNCEDNFEENHCEENYNFMNEPENVCEKCTETSDQVYE